MAIKKASEEEIQELRVLSASAAGSESKFFTLFAEFESDIDLDDDEIKTIRERYKRNFQRKNLKYDTYLKMIELVKQLNDESISEKIVCKSVESVIKHEGLAQLMSDFSNTVWKKNKS